jgi:hypothetical protein
MALRRGKSSASAEAGTRAAKKAGKKAGKKADKARRKAEKAATTVEKQATKAAAAAKKEAEQAGDLVSRAAGTALAAVEAVTADKPSRKAAKQARKDAGKAQKALAKEAGTAPVKDLTPANTRRLISVGKAVAPLVLPYAIAGATVARDRWDTHRARRLGVPADQLGQFTGRGGHLHARLSRAGEALAQLPADKKAFADETRPRLADLAVAVRAAEQMPATRRRTAFKAVSGELDRIEDALLGHLGITP